MVSFWLFIFSFWPSPKVLLTSVPYNSATPLGHVVQITNVDGKQELKLILGSGTEYDSKKYATTELESKGYRKYEDTCYLDKLNAYYQGAYINNKLILKRSRKIDLELHPMGYNRFRTSEVDFRLIEFVAENAGSFHKIKLSNSVLKNIEFIKI